MARFGESVRGWQGALQSAYLDAFEKERITLVGLFVPRDLGGDDAQESPGARAPGRGDSQPRGVRGMITTKGGQSRHLSRRPLLTYRMSEPDRRAVPRLMRIMADILLAAGAEEVFLPILGLGGIDADRLRSLDLEGIPLRSSNAAHSTRSALAHGSRTPTDRWSTRRPGVGASRTYVVDGSIVPTSSA